MTDFSFNFNQVDSVLQEMNTTTTRIQQALEEMEANVESGLAEWTGAARDQYYICKTKWDASAAQMAQFLVQAQTALATVSETYGHNERGVTSGWQM